MRFLFAVLRWVAAFAVLALIYVVGGFAWSSPSVTARLVHTPMVEMIDKNEDFYTARIIESAIALSMSSREPTDSVVQGFDDWPRCQRRAPHFLVQRRLLDFRRPPTGGMSTRRAMAA